ncbi:IS110 family transposase [Mycobacterium spongiae]|uniref:IS110 family transposase n=1 Tax=Mycobacterium spongiae TaxID=886343 RepID=UPI001FE30BE0|nr:IS110 family transposase [Mycobacterium spongiae]
MRSSDNPAKTLDEPPPRRASKSTTLFCGIDWGESRHDAAIIDHTGEVITHAKITTDTAGFSQLPTMLTEAGDTEDDPIPIGLDTDRGRLVAALRSNGRAIYPLNTLVPLPGTPSRVGGQSRRHRRGDAGQYPAHRHGRALADARRYRTGPNHQSLGARPAGRGVGASETRQPDPLSA